MNIPSQIIPPLISGLSMGAFCMSYCFPFVTPYIAADRQNFKKNIILTLKFLIGRFIGYALFGLIFGYLGERLESRAYYLISGIAIVLLSLLLLLYLLGLTNDQSIFCAIAKRHKSKSILVMGFLLGINICPPFLMSLAYVFSLKSMWGGLVYFSLFFLASSIYFIPMPLIGLLSRFREIRLAAKLSGFLVGIIFFIYGIHSIVNNLK